MGGKEEGREEGGEGLFILSDRIFLVIFYFNNLFDTFVYIRNVF